jgi:predicted Co/Zn/Cd cation transporter (cation efflux family)
MELMMMAFCTFEMRATSPLIVAFMALNLVIMVKSYVVPLLLPTSTKLKLQIKSKTSDPCEEEENLGRRHFINAIGLGLSAELAIDLGHRLPNSSVDAFVQAKSDIKGKFKSHAAYCNMSFSPLRTLQIW